MTGLRVLAALLAITALPACTITRERFGSPIVHERVEAFVPGVTTLPAALDALGPPDEIERIGDGVRLVYRHRARHERRFRISYRLELVSIIDGEATDDVLKIDFDANDRLRRIAEHTRSASE